MPYFFGPKKRKLERHLPAAIMPIFARANAHDVAAHATCLAAALIIGA
jgi:hypothetical protein